MFSCAYCILVNFPGKKKILIMYLYSVLAKNLVLFGAHFLEGTVRKPS